MKKLILPTILLACILSSNIAGAQLRVGLGLNVNIGARPSWGVPGNYAGNYYYMPEIDSYYDIANQQFIYDENGQWVYADNLPYAYRGYDLNSGYKVVINEPRPYLHADFYRQQYRAHYNTYRRPEVYAQQYARPNYRNDQRLDYRNDQRYNGQQYNNNRNDQRFNEQRSNNNDRFNQGRSNDNRGGAQHNDRMDNRNERGHEQSHTQPDEHGSRNAQRRG